jgi:hypothetical protein
MISWPSSPLRAGRAQLHADRDRDQQRRDQHQDHAREHHVADAFDEFVRSGKGRLADTHHRHAVHVLKPSLDDADAENVGHEEERCGRALHLLEQLDDAWLRTERQGDVYLAHPVLGGVRSNLRQVAEHARFRSGIDSALGAIVEVAHEVDALTLTCLERPCNLDSEGARTDHDRRATGSGPCRMTQHEDSPCPSRKPLQNRGDQRPLEKDIVLEEVKAARGVCAQGKNAHEDEPRGSNIHGGAEEVVSETVAARKRERKHEQAQRQRGPVHSFV